jgi:hypothetical protein
MTEHACPNCNCKPAPPRLAEGWIHIRRDGSFAYSCDRGQEPCSNAFASAFVREVADCPHPVGGDSRVAWCGECGARLTLNGGWQIPARQRLPGAAKGRNR